MKYIVMKKIREILIKTDKLIILAGAGFSADSGLPVFRSNNGFWDNYPQLNGKEFTQVSSPEMLYENEDLFQGFYIHRKNLYDSTNPHIGYKKLLDFINENNIDYFVLTTNVDEHFEKAGYSKDKIYEVHGSINHWQCGKYSCDSPIFPINEKIEVDNNLVPEHKVYCPKCESIARPNILMFGDFEFKSDRTDIQAKLFNQWYYNIFRHDDLNVTVLEFGAGQSVGRLRMQHSSILMDIPDAIGIRINTDPEEINLIRRNNMMLETKSSLEFINELCFYKP